MKTNAAPQRIGKYEVVRELGRGATGAVYLARDAFTRQELAIKLASAESLRDPVHGAHYKKQFFNEAFLAGTLKHPHIVALLDAVVDADHSYLVMEYVGGGTLKAFCDAQNLLPVAKVVEIVFKCCRALDYANRQGVIHRDIKPANILMAQDTDIKISDFGSALLTASEHTQVVGMVGSPAYMSPEQIKEQPLTFHGDIFSLGAVLYELLTGRMAFGGDNHFSIAYKIANEDPPPIHSVRPELPAALGKIVQRALKKDVAARFQSWDEFAQALSDIFTSANDKQDTVADAEKFAYLKKLPFFREFSEVELWEVVRISSWKKFDPNILLVKEGDVGQSFYILGSGEVQVLKGNKLLDVLKTGACFGEMAYLHQSAKPLRAASVVSNTPVLLIKIQSAALNEASQALQLRFNKIFVQTLIERLNTTNRRLSALAV